VRRLTITPLRLAAAVAIFGVAAGLGVWVATYEVQQPYVGPALAAPNIQYLPSYTSPAWTTPVAAMIGVAAVAAALFVLRRR
jgi:hypothetical protein